MTYCLPPLAAYRADRALTQQERFTAFDAELVRLGSLLHRRLLVRSQPALVDELTALRSECGKLANGILTVHCRRTSQHAVDSVQTAAGLVAAVLQIADLAEEGGALRTANSLLLLAYQDSAVEAGVLECGRIIAQRGRIARKSADAEGARELYLSVEALGLRHILPELVARAQVGFGMLARERGNLPSMREHFRNALASAERAGQKDVLAVAHHGLMLVAAAYKDFGEAVLHAWSAFRDVRGDSVREGDALLNVAQSLLDLGEPRIALHTFVAALSRTLPKRLELPALGGTAIAAAKVGDRAILDRAIERIEELAIGTDLRYEAIAACAEATFALTLAQDWRAVEWRSATVTEATRAGFHEIAFRLADPSVKVVSKRIPPSRALEAVFRDVESVCEWDLLQAAF